METKKETSTKRVTTVIHKGRAYIDMGDLLCWLYGEPRTQETCTLLISELERMRGNHYNTT